MKLALRSGDEIQVVAGKDKGKRGKITKIVKERDRVLVEGVNLAKRHIRANQNDPQGGIVEKELPIHISNVMLIDPKKDAPTRVGRKKDKDGTWVRFSKKSDHIFK